LTAQPRPLSTEWAYKNIRAIRQGLDQHNADCEHPAEAILLHPYDHGLLRLEELWGVPLVADEAVPTKRFRVHCAARRDELERELPEDDVA
jgi:hypothetical protein